MYYILTAQKGMFSRISHFRLVEKLWQAITKKRGRMTMLAHACATTKSDAINRRQSSNTGRPPSTEGESKECIVPMVLLEAISAVRLNIGCYLKFLARENAKKDGHENTIETLDLVTAMCEMPDANIDSILVAANDRHIAEALSDTVINDSDIDLICVYKAYIIDHALTEWCTAFGNSNPRERADEEMVSAYYDLLKKQIEDFDIHNLEGLLAGAV